MYCIENKQVLKYMLLCIYNYLKTLVQGHLQQMDSFFLVCIQTPIHCPTVFK